MKKDFDIQFRLWINNGDDPFLAKGRVELLKLVAQTGSISAAAREMKMSYKKAWEMIDSMNQGAGKPLVSRVSGGKGGGGTEVTKEGQRMIVTYDKLVAECSAFIAERSKEMKL